MHKKTRQPEELEPLPDLHKCKGTHTADFSSAPQGQYTRFFPFSQAHLLSRNRIATCWFSGTSAFCLLSVRFFLCLFHTVRRVFSAAALPFFITFRENRKKTRQPGRAGTSSGACAGVRAPTQQTSLRREGSIHDFPLFHKRERRILSYFSNRVCGQKGAV